ncbi:MAG: Chitinase, partial [Polaromonas sp.]|nr:Chitinase [Polaromonas sp.]
EGTARRTRVLARLQAKYPDMQVSFTLPSWLRGFNAESMDLLRTTLAGGVRIDLVNVMTQSFGVENIRTMVVPSTVAQASIVSFQATAAQMMPLFPNKSQAQLHAMMGITLMSGINDDGAVFTLADAQTVANFVKQNGIGFIGTWSFQRDVAQSRSGMGPLNNYTGVVQSDYQFHKIFSSANSGGAPAPAPPAATPPAATPAPAAGSQPRWVEGKPYAVGNIVTYSDGKQYVAKYANPGYNPTISTYFWAPYTAPAKPVVVAPEAPKPQPSACNSSNWVQGKQYAAGSIVTYSDSKQYIAKFANPGYNPTISTYFWSRYVC